VYGENVRQALQFAESGNAEATLTAWPLILGKPGAVQIPGNFHQPIRQVGGVTKSTKQRPLALAFLDFLTKGPGSAILEKAGFLKP
jgi:molybdate transport system substrate-binding protein